MDKKTFDKLGRGDIVTHALDSRTFIVNANYGDRVIAMTTIEMTNPSERILVLKASYNNSLKATSLPDRESTQGIDGRETP